MSLYFFDPTARDPGPRAGVRPRGRPVRVVAGARAADPTATSDPQDVTRTLLPAGLHATGSRCRSPCRRSPRCPCRATPAAVDEQTSRADAGPAVWTLRQEPRIRAVQLSIGDEDDRPARRGHAGQPRCRQRLRPHRLPASGDLFAPRRRTRRTGLDRLVAGHVGPLGHRTGSACAPSASTSRATRVAGVSGDGTERAASGRSTSRGGGRGRQRGRRPAPPGLGLPRPHLGARPGGGARGHQRRGRTAGRARSTVPGVSGRDVDQLLVSRDGSRLVAVVRTPQGRPRRRQPDPARRGGAVLRAHRAVVLDFVPDGANPRIRDIGWRSPTAGLGAERHHRRPLPGRARSRSTGLRASSAIERRRPGCAAAPAARLLAGGGRRGVRPRPAAVVSDLTGSRAADRPVCPRTHVADLRRLSPLHRRPRRGLWRATARCCDGCVLDEALDLLPRQPVRRLRTARPDAVPGLPRRPAGGPRVRWPHADAPRPGDARGSRRLRRRGPGAGRGPQGPRPVASPAGAGRPAGACGARRPLASTPTVPLLLVPVPSRPGAGRRRGYDPMGALVRLAVARLRAESYDVERGAAPGLAPGRRRPGRARRERAGDQPGRLDALPFAGAGAAGRRRGPGAGRDLRRRADDRRDRREAQRALEAVGLSAGRHRRGGGHAAPPFRDQDTG